MMRWPLAHKRAEEGAGMTGEALADAVSQRALRRTALIPFGPFNAPSSPFPSPPAPLCTRSLTIPRLPSRPLPVCPSPVPAGTIILLIVQLSSLSTRNPKRTAPSQPGSQPASKPACEARSTFCLPRQPRKHVPVRHTQPGPFLHISLCTHLSPLSIPLLPSSSSSDILLPPRATVHIPTGRPNIPSA